MRGAIGKHMAHSGNALTASEKNRTITAARRRGKSMENEKLFLALRAGARAIVNNKRLHGVLYCWDIWGENGGPKEISYLEAATLLAETADKMEERPPEGEDNEKTNT